MATTMIDMQNEIPALARGIGEQACANRTPDKAKTILVCGGHPAINEQRLFAVLDRLLADEGEFRIVHAGGGGADLLATKWAVAHRVRAITERASWFKYGRSAGPLRNEHMLNFYEPFLVVAFPGGSNSADLVARARRAGVRVIEMDMP